MYIDKYIVGDTTRYVRNGLTLAHIKHHQHGHGHTAWLPYYSATELEPTIPPEDRNFDDLEDAIDWVESALKKIGFEVPLDYVTMPRVAA